MGALALNITPDEHVEEMLSYVCGYWYSHDIWRIEDKAFQDDEIDTNGQNGILVDLSSYNKMLKLEMKFYLLHSLKNKELSVANIKKHYQEAISYIGKDYTENSFKGVKVKPATMQGKELCRIYELVQRNVISFITDFYDERPELERDKWHAVLIPGVKLSAAIKRTKPSMSFEEIPLYYRESVKRYMKTLIYRRSWSFCTEVLVYIRYFFKCFYRNEYTDGFLGELTRIDVEKYLQWVAEDYENNNATFRSKAVSFIRNWLDFIQLAEFKEAPKKDVTRLIFDDDIPKRERQADTFEKIKTT